MKTIIQKALFSMLFSVFLILPSTKAFAVTLTLDEYETMVKVARNRLNYFLEEESAMSKATESERSEICRGDVLAQVRKMFPAEMTVVKEPAQGRTSESFEISNEWFLKKLDEIEKAKDRNDKVLEAIYALEAIQESIWRIKQEDIYAGISKDEEKRKLEEILNRLEFARAEEKKKNSLEAFVDKILRWLFDKVLRVNLPDEGPNFESSEKWLKSAFQAVFLIVVIAFIGFLFYRFASHLIEVSKTSESNDGRIILGEIISDEENSGTIFDEAEKLAISGDLRNAIRKGYIAFLCELGDRKVIKLSGHKTNRDYLRETSKNREVHEGMKYLTNYFERFWYGLKRPEMKDWENFRAKYFQTINRV